MTEEEKRLRKRKIRMALVVVVFILLLLLLFPPGCDKQEKAPAPMPVAKEQFPPPPLLIVEIDEYPIKVSDAMKKFAREHNGGTRLTFIAFDNTDDVRLALKAHFIDKGIKLYELALPGGRTYSESGASYGLVFLVFDNLALAEKFVAENMLAVEMSVSIRELDIPEEEIGGLDESRQIHSTE